ncbi:hypothetical protein DKX38_019559 [Salix brachista]|uniref:protein-serine/threonine phosphatase n=1 Tax=Salix brachista TaxID=2182728 RepID=A0A5N5KGU4_9ROSI|nr:hypothetical protein DKX38_019559 [Salix brachista]
MHGGLSPELNHLDQIRNLQRPSDVPDTGLLCDLLWSDPSKDVQGWGMNDRGVSYTFGPEKVKEFLQKLDLDLICRAHQVVEDGYEFFANRQLVTIFSAPNYCGEFDNAGAMMSVDETLMCSFQILKPADKKSKSGAGNTSTGGGLFGSTTTAKPGNPPPGVKVKERALPRHKIGFEGRRLRFPFLLDCTLTAARIAAMNYSHVALIVPHICETPNHVESSKQYTRDSGQATGLEMPAFYVVIVRVFLCCEVLKSWEWRSNSIKVRTGPVGIPVCSVFDQNSQISTGVKPENGVEAALSLAGNFSTRVLSFCK